MATGRSTKLTGATGEFLVAAELCRRDMIATAFSGNVPYYDIVASGPEGDHVPVQVKAINGNAWQFILKSFVSIDFDGDRQIIGHETPHPVSEPPGRSCCSEEEIERTPSLFHTELATFA